MKPALEEDFDKEEEEPAFEVSNDTKEEDQAYRGDVSQPYNPRLDLEFYRFPTLDLLNTYQNDDPDIDMEEQNANKNRIIKVLRSFGIEISSIKPVWVRPLPYMRLRRRKGYVSRKSVTWRTTSP